jgi:hypothetical protein
VCSVLITRQCNVGNLVSTEMDDAEEGSTPLHLPVADHASGTKPCAVQSVQGPPNPRAGEGALGGLATIDLSPVGTDWSFHSLPSAQAEAQTLKHRTATEALHLAHLRRWPFSSVMPSKYF